MSKPTALTWTNSKRKLRELTGWKFNPRQISVEHGKRLLDSLTEFGQFQTIAITPDNTIVDGHQRNAVWAASDKYGLDYEVDVRVASRNLTNKERAKLVVLAHKGATGEWDFDALANLPEIDVADLVEFGFDEAELGIIAEQDWPNLPDVNKHVVSVRYEIEDEPALKSFIGQNDDLPLQPVQTGQKILEQIKNIVANRAD